MLSRLSLVVCIILLLSSTALASSGPFEAGRARGFPLPPIRAWAAVVMDADNGKVLGAKNERLHLPMASTTKIMTALLALQIGRLSDRVTVPSSAFDFESDATVMGLHPGQVVTLQDLLYGLLLPSGADAANTIAIHYAGSEARFVDLMNREAVLLGLRDTHYVNPHGLTAHGQYTSAYDLATLGRYVSSIPEFMKIVGTRTYAWDGHVLTNLNKVLFWYPGVDGIKPGYTDDAGICQLLDAQRDGRHVIVALLHTPDLEIDARSLLDFGLRDFTWAQSPLPGDGPTLTLTGADRAGAYVYFSGSGHYVRGKLWTAYLANGGLAALGFPRTEALGEGRTQVQYFQNGALALDPSSGRVARLALGLTPLPSPAPPTATPTPSPSPTVPPTATATPQERSFSLSGTPTITVPAGGRAHAASPTPTPIPRPTPPRASPTATSAPRPAPKTAIVFSAFQRAHWGLLGKVASGLQYRDGYGLQMFSYGALVYQQRTHAIYLLPLGDRLLSARHYLAAHPGNVYPAGFAPIAILRAIGWPPYGQRK